jgi:hypothetical protein
MFSHTLDFVLFWITRTCPFIQSSVFQTSSTIFSFSHTLMYTLTHHGIALDTSTLCDGIFMLVSACRTHILSPTVWEDQFETKDTAVSYIHANSARAPKECYNTKYERFLFLLLLWTKPSRSYGNCSLGFLNQGSSLSAVYLIISST